MTWEVFVPPSLYVDYKQSLVHRRWFNILLGGFTQYVTNWRMVKILVPHRDTQLLFCDPVLSRLQELSKNLKLLIGVGSYFLEFEHEEFVVISFSSFDTAVIVYGLSYFLYIMDSCYLGLRPQEPCICTVRLILPRSSISRIIGRHGGTIKLVQQESHLVMSVSGLDKNYSERVLLLQGEMTNTENFHYLVECVVRVLQTDRNYMFSFSFLSQNDGRPDLPRDAVAKRDLEKLKELLTESVRGADKGQFLDSLLPADNPNLLLASQLHSLRLRRPCEATFCALIFPQLCDCDQSDVDGRRDVSLTRARSNAVFGNKDANNCKERFRKSLSNTSIDTLPVSPRAPPHYPNLISHNMNVQTWEPMLDGASEKPLDGPWNPRES